MIVTAYGVASLTFTVLMYAFEARGRAFVAGFSLGCLLSSGFGFLSGTWPFGVVELVWSGIALRRLRHAVPS